MVISSPMGTCLGGEGRLRGHYHTNILFQIYLLVYAVFLGMSTKKNTEIEPKSIASHLYLAVDRHSRGAIRGILRRRSTIKVI